MRLILIGFFLLIHAGCESKNASAENYQFPEKAEIQIDQAAVRDLKALSRGVGAIANQASNALVFITVARIAEGPEGRSHPFDHFFGPPPDHMPGEQGPRQEGLGSGFFVDLANGYIMTNNHVIADADEIKLELADGEVYEGQVLGRDSNTDIAILKIADPEFNRDGLTQLSFADDQEITVGDFVLALGAPFGLDASVSFGVISALDRGTLGITALGNFIQTDAAINPGNSGGPLMSLDGEVIGLNTAIFSATGANGGIGFAVPASLAKEIGERLINDGEIRRGFLGVTLQSLNEELAYVLGIDAGVEGAIVARLEEGGPGDKAGIEAGDVIVGIDDEAMENETQIINYVGMMRPKTEVKIRVMRQGQEKVFAVVLGEFPSPERVRSDDRPEKAPSSSDSQERGDDLGLHTAPLTDDLKKQYSIEASEGAVVLDIEPLSVAAASGLRVGDLILQVNGQSIEKPADLEQVIGGSEGRGLLFRVERSGDYFFVGIRR